MSHRKVPASTPLPMSFVSVAVTGLDGITTKRRTSHKNTRKVGLPIHPRFSPLRFCMKGSTFWSESDLSRTTLGRWTHDSIVRALFLACEIMIAYTLGTPLLLVQLSMKLLFHLLTPYKLGQCTEVSLSFIKVFGSNVVSHVCLVRGSAKWCDTQRLNKAIHGLGR